VKDKATQSLMLQRGDADVALDLTVEQVEAIKGKPDITIHQALSLNTVYFGMNTAIKPFDNPKVREAVKYAIDYEGIQKGLMGGGGKLVATPVPVGITGMTDALNDSLRYKEDLDKARALLKESGAANVRAKLMYEAGGSHGTLSNDRLAQKLRADLGRVGVTLELQPLASSIFLTTYREKKEEVVIGTWNPDFIDPDNWSYFVNGFINGRVHWEHPDGKQTVESALKTSAPQKRAELYQQYYRILAAPATPFAGLVQWEVRFPARSNITDFRYHPLYYFEIDRAKRK
jgi:peptide/nickel transport system substrate-binding protein